MKKILLSSDPAAGNGDTKPTPQPTATPPLAAAVAAAGKTELEIKLERENAALKNAVKKTAESKRKAEETSAHISRENQKLKEIQLGSIKPAQPAQPAKGAAWGFFNS